MLGTGESTSQALELPAGRWHLSLQYFSPFDLTLSAPGFRQRAAGGARRPAAEHDQPRQQRPVLAGRALRERGRPGRASPSPRPSRAPCSSSAATTARPTSASWSRSGRAAPDRAAQRTPATAGSTGTRVRPAKRPRERACLTRRPGRIALSGLEALRRNPHDVPDQADLLQAVDDQRRDVDLPAAEAVDGGGREGVVVVVPGLAEGRDRDQRQVARLVARSRSRACRRRGRAS